MTIQAESTGKVTQTLEALKKNRFGVQHFSNASAGVANLLEEIPVEATVGFGGSWTLMQLQVAEQLEARGNVVFNHNKQGLSKDEVLEMRQKELSCDVFLTSTNALTVGGQLVNVDGVGNRVSAMVFGPKKVIVFAGVNKIVDDLEGALERIRAIAAPRNNQRLKLPNPCVQSGHCMNCQGPTRICNVTTIIDKKPPLTDLQVWLVEEELGY